MLRESRRKVKEEMDKLLVEISEIKKSATTLSRLEVCSIYGIFTFIFHSALYLIFVHVFKLNYLVGKRSIMSLCIQGSYYKLAVSVAENFAGFQSVIKRFAKYASIWPWF